MIVLIGGEKGGTGKTTIATNLAAMRVMKGRDVLLIDTDKQASASSWAASRDEREDTRRVPTIQKFGTGLAAEIRDLAKRYQDIIIDAGGRDSVELRAAMTLAHKVFVPIQASQFDVWTLGQMDSLINQARGFNPDLDANVVINRASTNHAVSESQEAFELLSDFEHLKVAKALLRDRIAFRKAAKNGLSVVELKPADGKANREITQLYEEIFDEQ